MKNLVKLTLLSGAIGIVGSAHAELYAGINGGASIVTITKDIDYAHTDTDMSDKYTGLRGQILVGYNFHLPNGGLSLGYGYSDNENTEDEAGPADELYVAIEADGNYLSNSASSNISPWFLTYNASVREKALYGYDFFLLPKYRIARNLVLFIGPGYSQGFLKVSTPSDTGGNLGITGSASEWLHGWSVKAGIEIPVTCNMRAVITYQYSSFSGASWTRTEPFTHDVVSARYKPIINSLTLGVNFQV